MFEHLKRLDPSNRRSWCRLPDVAPGCAIELQYAGESNKPYYNAMLRKAAKRLRETGGRLERVDAEMVGQNREEDRVLYPQYVITNWRNVVDTDGNEVPFTREHVAEFCRELPDHLMDQLRDHASAPENYLEEAETPPDAEALAGN